MPVLPFTAFVDLEELKTALVSLAVDPTIGGLLISGPKGTGKSSIVRAFAEILPEIEVVADCPYGCDPRNPQFMCEQCRRRLEQGEKLPVKRVKMKVVELPIGATEDMVLGTINIERTLKEGRVVFEPGILARANRNILYIDEVNLLPDHIVDAILDAAASGWNRVEREGISVSHPAKFILIGTMNPEEGELRPQLLDRFAIGVTLTTIKDPKLRAEIVRRNLLAEQDYDAFRRAWAEKQEELKRRIVEARKRLHNVKVGDDKVLLVTSVCSALDVDGYRPDIVAIKVARALAAFNGRSEVSEEDIVSGLKLALAHRTRAGGLKPPATPEEITVAVNELASKKIKVKAGTPSGERGKPRRFFRGL